MSDAISADEQSNYETFRECLSEPILRALAAPAEQPKPKPKRKRHVKKASKSGQNNVLEDDQAPKETIKADDTQSTAAEDLGEFIDV